MKKYTINDFINKSNKIHNNKYDYSLVQYKNNKTKVKIICPVHGVFEQIPQNHLLGSNCIKCTNDKQSKSTNNFIKESNKVYNNKYDYSLVQYKNNKTKVKIICPVHGVFEQSPTNHLLLKHECNKCKIDKKRKQIDIFIKESNKVHNNKYDYSLVQYKNTHTKIDIICPIHGLFKQRPHNHLIGNGCPICNESKGEKEIRKILENNNIKYIKEKTLQGCKDKGLLKFDFYLPNYNTCIEFDGIQHFKFINFFGNKTKFNELKNRDKIKNKFCNNNNINLIRIKYSDNILEKLILLF